jgi:hypothetical protein
VWVTKYFYQNVQKNYPDIIIKVANYHSEAQTWSEAAQMGQNGTKSAQTEHKTTNILGIFRRKVAPL